MTDPGIKRRTAELVRVLKELSSQEVSRPPPSRIPPHGDQFVGVHLGDPAHGSQRGEAWAAVVESSMAFWASDVGGKDAGRRFAAADVARTLDGLEGVIATGEASALLEDWGRLIHGFVTLYGGDLPAHAAALLSELRDLLADRTRGFVETLHHDLLQSKETVLSLLDEDGRAFAGVVLDALSRKTPIDRGLLDAATQNLRATLSRADYQTAHTREIDVLAKRLEWLHAALTLETSPLGSR